MKTNSIIVILLAFLFSLNLDAQVKIRKDIGHNYGKPNMFIPVGGSRDHDIVPHNIINEIVKKIFTLESIKFIQNTTITGPTKIVASSEVRIGRAVTDKREEGPVILTGDIEVETNLLTLGDDIDLEKDIDFTMVSPKSVSNCTVTPN